MPEPAVVLDAVTVTLPDAAAATLRGVSVAVEEGELALVVGRTGVGKSTLLGAMTGAVPHFTGGTLAGDVRVHGRSTRTWRPRDLADLVGTVGQDPLAGFVTDTVEEELAYGMEQLGLSGAVMRTRVEEVLDVMGIAELREAPLRELSGGQQQRVAIGAVLTAHPRVIVLDEPTSALDPTGAEEVLATITRLVHDLAVTVVVAEHRIERVLQYADTVLAVGADGRVRQGAPAEVMEDADVAPPVVELGRYAGWSPLPLSVRDARRRGTALRAELARVAVERPAPAAPSARRGGPTVLAARGVVVRHGDVIAVAGVDLDLRAGEVTALMGRNGSGKSSLLWALQGSGSRAAGTVVVHPSGGGPALDPAALDRATLDPAALDPAALDPAARRRHVGLVPQSATDLLYLDTVGAECAQADAESGVPPGTCAELLERLVPGLDRLRHPRDLSEGQRLAVVLAIQLTADPEVLLLDEPTRGLDYPAKAALRQTVRELVARGRSVVVATHDVEVVAATADRVVLLAAGEVVADGSAAEVMGSSPALAPQIAKITAPGPWLTLGDVVTALDAEVSR
ncbi:MAG TPA: ATP-binding cassette domain-containing protein [Dermatophilaceae bacterium]|nr:ATP-binding cassette domain-containing protein [Dermatophilaceae bacterium]